MSVLFPTHVELKLKAVHSKILPKALFGVETTPVSAKAHASLKASVKGALATGNKAMCNIEALCATWGARSPDPWLVIALRRVKRLRIMYHASHAWRERIDTILVNHIQCGTHGCFREEDPPGQISLRLMLKFPPGRATHASMRREDPLASS